MDQQEITNEALLAVLLKLIGNVDPVGETTQDNESFENLKTLCFIADKLIDIVDDVHFKNKDSKEHSVKRSADAALNFLIETAGYTNY